MYTTSIRKEANFEHEVIEAVIDINYRRLIDDRSIDISIGGVHNIVFGSDIDQFDQDPIDLKDLSDAMPDGTGVKQQMGIKGELRADISITNDKKLEPLGTFINTDWAQIETIIKERIKATEASGIPFIYDGEPGLDNFLLTLIFINIEIWLKTVVIAAKTISLLERDFREIGRGLKRIAYGSSDAAVTKLSKMIVFKMYRKYKWEQYWKQKKPGIDGNFSIQIIKAKIRQCHNF